MNTATITNGFKSQREFQSLIQSEFISPEVYWKACDGFNTEKKGVQRDAQSAESQDLLNTIDSGRKAEWVLFEQVREWGYDVKLGNGRGISDFAIDFDNEWCGMEAKSARNCKNRYNFHGIQPDKSMATIFMFIRPEGLECRIANTERLCDWASKHYTYITEGKKSGYSIGYNATTLRNPHENGMEIFKPMTKENIERAVYDCWDK